MKFLEGKVKGIIIDALNDPEVMSEVLRFANRFTKEYVRTQAEKIIADGPIFKKP